ncbi:hypothetical protein KSD_40520 [Ktedonobacter sp. SOSP1-85]|uniref:acylphosphatase n=1 Tax=Ktedonobacter sp. SOSP1-85 TaxID=2778367 RepID=UPI0019155C5B|nr:acylphosphatase [Ktedonobacter sp. SOSP1-85]GHO76281.1 hypothetical protein KSD_40520 [Ktedonobacter sp. SOSP1-85]
MSQSENKHSPTQVEELYAIVQGWVQGVGFRQFVVQQARALHLRGYTRNKSNGDVEVVAQGPRLVLEQLLEHLRQGPSAADVRHVEAEWRTPGEAMSNFTIRW